MDNPRVLVVLMLAALAAASPPRVLDCRYVAFTAPLPGATVSGPVEVRGRALILDFQFYKVEYSLPGRDEWTIIGTDVVRQPVENGRLVLWQTTTVPDGSYRLRLRVVDLTGNYCEAILSPLTVMNVRATAPPPTPTDTPVLTAVPPGPTLTLPPTVAVEVPPVRNTPGALPTRGSPFAPSSSDVTVTAAFFLFGVCGMLAIMFAVGAVLLIRYLTGER